MRGLFAICGIARADFFERTRRYQYLATVVVTLLLGVLFVPARNANYVAFTVDGYRGVYNSAWMGAMLAMLATVTISLFGFYLVKSAIDVDRQTRVGEIVAATSVSKFQYIAGKWLGNVAVLFSLSAFLCVDAVVMQLVRGEDRTIDLLAIVTPFVVVALPVIAIVAAVAVLFEAIPFLRGGIGNVVYFFAWVFGLSAGAQSVSRIPSPWNDAMGIYAVGKQVNAAIAAIAPHAAKRDFDLVIGGSRETGHYFVWHGFTWTLSVLMGRAVWLLVAVAIVAFAALVFDRFASGSRAASERAPKAWQLGFAKAAERVTTPSFDIIFRGDFGTLVLAELRLMLKGLNFWWYAVAIGLWIATLATPAAEQSIALGMAWLWPVLIWSQMGTRETIDDTQGFVYPSLHPLRRQFLALWIAGVLLALLTGSGSLLHWALAGNTMGVLGVLAGTLFIPSLALACGAASGTSRTFEIVYLIWWYIGPLNNGKSLDFTAFSGSAITLMTAVIALGVAFSARRLRLQAA